MIERFEASEQPVRTAGLVLLGDNLMAMASLESGEIPSYAGPARLAYVDPPFDTGDDFSSRVIARGRGERDTLAQLAQYRDHWTVDEYLEFLYERMRKVRDLLASDGSVYVHCDYRRSHHIRILMDEVFGRDHLRNEIVWFYPSGGDSERQFNRKHDTLLWYTVGDSWTFNYKDVLIPYTAAQLARFDQADESGRFYWNVNPRGERVKTYLRKPGIGEYDVWTIGIDANAAHQYRYPTTKPVALLERILKASSSPGDMVLDCFAGSGTTAVAAQRLGRQWVMIDSNPVAVRTALRRVTPHLTQAARSADAGTLGLVEDVASGAGTTAYEMWSYEPISEQQSRWAIAVRHKRGSVELRIVPEQSDVRVDRHVDGVLIDFDHDGETMRLDVADIPGRRDSGVRGTYTIPVAAGDTIGVIVVDVFGGSERIMIRREVGGTWPT